MNKRFWILFLVGFLPTFGAGISPFFGLSGGRRDFGAPAEPPSGECRINCGATIDYVDSAANTWLADTDHTSSAGTYSVTADISGTTDDFLHQTERSAATGTNVVYAIDPTDYGMTAAGDFDVTIGFTEIYRTDNGRQNTVTIEGGTEFDVTAGTRYVAAEATAQITISGPTIDIVGLGSVATPAKTKFAYIYIRPHVASAPDAPVITATPGDARVTISGTTPDGLTSIEVWKDTSSSVDTSGAADFTITGWPLVDTAVSNGTTYYYRAQAVNADGNSADSNEASATPVDPGGEPSGLVFYVATDGDNADPGTEAEPFATLARARDAIRTATGRTSVGGSPGESWEGATIFVRGGTYYFSSLLTFDSRDQGTSSHPYVVSAYPAETVRFTGAVAISNESWSQATGSAFGNARLPAPSSTYYISWNSGDLRPDEAALLFDDGVLVKYSTFPNGAGGIQDEDSWFGTDLVSYTPGNPNPSVFDINGTGDTTPGGWAESGQDIICFGVLGEDWSSSWNDVTSISPVSGGSRVTIADTRGPYATHDNQFMRFWNVMEAVTSGTTVHADAQGLYFYRTAGDNAPTGVDISSMDTIIRCGVNGSPSDASDFLTFKDIRIDGCRLQAIQFYSQTGGGLNNCVVNGNGTGVYIKNCTDVGIWDSTLSNNIQFAVVWDTCGNKATLTESGSYMTGNTITGNCWGSDGQGNQAVRLQGAGCGFLFQDNDCVGQYSGDFAQDAAGGWPYVIVNDNDFIGGNLFLSDIGACYMGRAQAAPGCEITNNRFTDITVNNAPGSGAVYAVYLDDTFSWATVDDNVFDNCDHAMQLASGKGTVVRRNKFTDCNDGHHGAPVVMADRSGFPTVRTAVEAELAIYGSAPAIVAVNPDIERFKVGGDLNSMLLRFWNAAGTGLTFVDNMNTTAENIARIVSPPNTDINLTQLNYPPGSSGTPTEGGGSVALSTMYHVTP